MHYVKREIPEPAKKSAQLSPRVDRRRRSQENKGLPEVQRVRRSKKEESKVLKEKLKQMIKTNLDQKRISSIDLDQEKRNSIVLQISQTLKNLK